MAKIGVLLSGCGMYDGSEIHESVITLLALDRKGVEAVCMAPDVVQKDVVNHITGAPGSGERNVLAESARIARGNISDVAKVSAEELDGLIIPGGFGSAKNLSDFAFTGKDAVVNSDVSKFINDMVSLKKPVGAICIAPATLTKALADKNPKVTIGCDEGTAQAVEAMGGKHVECSVDSIVFDEENRIVTTPAYMLGPTIKDIAKGIEKLVDKVCELIE